MIEFLAAATVVVTGNWAFWTLGRQAERKRCLDICSSYKVAHSWSPERYHAAYTIAGQIK